MVVDPSGRCPGLRRGGQREPGRRRAGERRGGGGGERGEGTGGGSRCRVQRSGSSCSRWPGRAAPPPRRSSTIGSRPSALDAPLVHESDLLATYCSGTHRPDGYAVVAGTGAGAIRLERGRQVAVADGLGWLLGDEGSGFWIGHRVVRAALADLDGRGPATGLTPLVLARLGVPGVVRGRGPGAGAGRGARRSTPTHRSGWPTSPALVFETPRGTRPPKASSTTLPRPSARTLTAVRAPAVSGPGRARRRHPGPRRSGRREDRRDVRRNGGPGGGRRSRRRRRPRPPTRRHRRRRGRLRVR